ncbi:MAG: lamin tail domain-containing protein [Chloroflexota bacterium]
MQRYSQIARGSLILFLLAGLLIGLVGPRVMDVGAAPAAIPQIEQTATNIVISEFRTRGPNGADDEFIELYNPTSNPIDISGWEIHGSNNAGGGTTTPRATVPGGITLNPGQYYLVANSSTNGYSGTTVPNLTYGTGITDDGGVALTLANDTPVDQVGMSAGSAYQEGAVLSPLTTNTNQSYERLLGGASDSCEDTSNNFADFAVISPSTPQNLASPWSLCGVAVPATNTPTASSTTTMTNTPTSTGTATPTPNCQTTSTTAPLTLVINEVAWAGTAANTSDEWLELYNPGTLGCIDLDGWRLRAEDGSLDIDLSGEVIQAGGYFLLERTDDTTVSDITADLIYTGDLSNEGEKLFLENNGVRIDSANIDAGPWPAGSTTSFRSMERYRSNVSDIPTNWVTNTGVVRNGKDANGASINGTPRQQNWAAIVTITPTRTPTKRPTPRPPTPSGRPVINEFLPRPGFDWNQDGRIDVFDEFIEIKNIGPVAINISGWTLDDGGTNSFSLPSITLDPGDRVLFYGLETNILLSDGGDQVRLLSSGGVIMDSYTYGIVKEVDQSWCRLPEGRDWYDDCVPTPGLLNTREGEVPAMPPRNPLQPAICQLPDTLPSDFLFAECNGYGANMWSSMYWDEDGWQGEQLVPDNESKWQSFIQ